MVMPWRMRSASNRPAASRAVPEFFRRMAATEDGDLKVRVALRAEWVDDGTVEGAITESRVIVNTLAEEYDEDDYVQLTAAERSRIQMIYIPASRDGVRQVTAFLRSRLRGALRSGQLACVTSSVATRLKSLRSSPKSPWSRRSKAH